MFILFLPEGALARNTRDRILEAAGELLVRSGPQASMQQIAAEAGVAIGSLYNHFASKEALMRALYGALAEALDQAVIQPEGGTPEERLKGYIDAYIRFFWDDPARAVQFELLSCLPLVTPAELRDHFAASADHVAGLIGDYGRANGGLPAEPGQLAGFIGGALRNTLKWRRLREAPLSASEVAEMHALCFAVLRG